MSFFKDFKADFTQAMNELMPDGNEMYDADELVEESIAQEEAELVKETKKEKAVKEKPVKEKSVKEKKSSLLKKGKNEQDVAPKTSEPDLSAVKSPTSNTEYSSGEDMDIAPEDMSDQIDDLLESELYSDETEPQMLLDDDMEVNTMDMSVEEMLSQLSLKQENAKEESIEMEDAVSKMQEENEEMIEDDVASKDALSIDDLLSQLDSSTISKQEDAADSSQVEEKELEEFVDTISPKEADVQDTDSGDTDLGLEELLNRIAGKNVDEKEEPVEMSMEIEDDEQLSLDMDEVENNNDEYKLHVVVDNDMTDSDTDDIEPEELGSENSISDEMSVQEKRLEESKLNEDADDEESEESKLDDADDEEPEEMVTTEEEALDAILKQFEENVSVAKVQFEQQEKKEIDEDLLADLSVDEDMIETEPTDSNSDVLEMSVAEQEDESSKIDRSEDESIVSEPQAEAVEQSEDDFVLDTTESDTELDAHIEEIIETESETLEDDISGIETLKSEAPITDVNYVKSEQMTTADLISQLSNLENMNTEKKVENAVEYREDLEDNKMNQENEVNMMNTVEETGVDTTMMMDEQAFNVEDADAETTYITKGSKIKGDLETEGSVDIIGTVEGSVICKGKVVVGGNVIGNITAGELYANSAKIEGNIKSYGSVKVGVGTVIVGGIEGESAVIAGAINGDIDVKGPVIVDSTAVIMGNIKSRSVQINNGAVIEGFCSQSYADVDVKSFFA